MVKKPETCRGYHWFQGGTCTNPNGCDLVDDI